MRIREEYKQLKNEDPVEVEATEPEPEPQPVAEPMAYQDWVNGLAARLLVEVAPVAVAEGRTLKEVLQDVADVASKTTK